MKYCNYHHSKFVFLFEENDFEYIYISFQTDLDDPCKTAFTLKKWSKDLRKIIFTTGRSCCVIGTHWGTAAGSERMHRTYYRPNQHQINGVELAIQFV